MKKDFLPYKIITMHIFFLYGLQKSMHRLSVKKNGIISNILHLLLITLKII